MSKNTEVVMRHNGNDPASAREGSQLRTVIPAADIYETQDAYVLALDMPGVSKETISLVIENGSLVVRAPAEARDGPGAALMYREISGGVYQRSFTIGDGVDVDRVDARYKDGILNITMLKAEEAKPKQIEVEVK